MRSYPLLLDAERFRRWYGGVEMVSTGLLRADLAETRAVLFAAQAQVMGLPQDMNPLNLDYPLGSLHIIAAHVELLNAELREQGFIPPAADHTIDPFGFIVENAAFLQRIEPMVVEPMRTIH